MNSKLLSQPELWAAITAVAGAAALVAKKLLARKSSRKVPHDSAITRAEFHAGLDDLRDRITAGYLAVTEKIDTRHREIERRLDALDTAVARLDERTLTSRPPHP